MSKIPECFKRLLQTYKDSVELAELLGFQDEEVVTIINACEAALASPLMTDGVPTLYISKDNPLTPITHRMRDDDIPVWCDAKDAMELMRRLNGAAR